MTTTRATTARITWWVWAGTEKIRHARTMRGTWGWDASCSCGWKTNTGGATRGYVRGEVDLHKLLDHA